MPTKGRRYVPSSVVNRMSCHVACVTRCEEPSEHSLSYLVVCCAVYSSLDGFCIYSNLFYRFYAVYLLWTFVRLLLSQNTRVLNSFYGGLFKSFTFSSLASLSFFVLK